MEGNACYKFSTIQNYVTQTNAKPIELALDIGANVGTISVMMRRYFPRAKVFGFEAVPHYYALSSDVRVIRISESTMSPSARLMCTTMTSGGSPSILQSH